MQNCLQIKLGNISELSNSTEHLKICGNLIGVWNTNRKYLGNYKDNLCHNMSDISIEFKVLYKSYIVSKVRTNNNNKTKLKLRAIKYCQLSTPQIILKGITLAFWHCFVALDHRPDKLLLTYFSLCPTVPAISYIIHFSLWGFAKKKQMKTKAQKHWEHWRHRSFVAMFPLGESWNSG